MHGLLHASDPVISGGEEIGSMGGGGTERDPFLKIFNYRLREGLILSFQDKLCVCVYVCVCVCVCVCMCEIVLG